MPDFYVQLHNYFTEDFLKSFIKSKLDSTLFFPVSEYIRTGVEYFSFFFCDLVKFRFAAVVIDSTLLRARDDH